MPPSSAGSDAFNVICPTCAAAYRIERYIPGQRYGCQRCSASLLFAKFALLQELGRGGFGVVYKAWQADLQRVVALKFLHSDSEEYAERFIREARIAANLTHPNIAPIYEVGQHEGKLYITMQFVDGSTVQKCDFSMRESAQIIRDAALAVDYAHARDIIHRDIKPQNIMVTQAERSGTSPGELTRRVFVMDFGLARTVSHGGTLTTAGQVLGTPAYMSPEQAEGRALDARSDVYSLGATLFSMVTRRAPFEATTPVQILMKVTQGKLTPPSQMNPEVDKGLEGIILKAMDVDPERRYATAGRLATDLTKWLAGEHTDAAPTVQVGATRPTTTMSGAAAGPRRGGLAVALLAALLVAGAGGYAVWKLQTAQPPPPPVVVAPPPSQPPPPPPVAPPVEVLQVTSEPPGATVRANGQAVEGATPLALTDRVLVNGDHEIEVSKAGYQTQKKTVAIEKGKPARADFKLERTPRAVAFRLDSEPRGAAILIDRKDTGRVTPQDIYRDEVAGPTVLVELELKGYLASQQPVDLTEAPKDIKVALKAQTGSILVRGLLPGATVYLFVSQGAKDPRSLFSLWSEDAGVVEKALETLHPDDGPRALQRVRDLAPKYERARKLSETVTPLKTGFVQKHTARVNADAVGTALLEGAQVLYRYRVFATAPSARDYLSEELQPIYREETALRAEMTALASIAALLRPAGTSLRVVVDGAEAGRVAADGKPVPIPAGEVTVSLAGPAPDAILDGFSLTRTLKAGERFDLSGNIYLHAAAALEKKGRPLEAERAYYRVLQEPSPPPSDSGIRATLPEKIRALYASWIDATVAAGRTLGGDLRQAIGEARRKSPVESSPALVNVYAARDATNEIRGEAASALASAHALLKQPYEAVEWIERTLREKTDPGAEAEALVAESVKGHAALAPRWDAAVKSIAGARKMASRKPGYLGLRVGEATGRGVRVEALAKGGPSEAAGIAVGDVIVEAAGTSVRSEADLASAVRGRPEGEELEVGLERGTERRSVKVVLAARPEQEPEWFKGAAGRLGVLQLVSERQGIFVKLEPGAQLAAGDVLQVMRDGAPVGELRVEKVVAKGDATYPNGSAECKKVSGLVKKGDEVRKRR